MTVMQSVDQVEVAGDAAVGTGAERFRPVKGQTDHEPLDVLWRVE
jgi:hypothetical protein